MVHNKLGVVPMRDVYPTIPADRRKQFYAVGVMEKILTHPVTYLNIYVQICCSLCLISSTFRYSSIVFLSNLSNGVRSAYIALKQRIWNVLITRPRQLWITNINPLSEGGFVYHCWAQNPSRSQLSQK